MMMLKTLILGLLLGLVLSQSAQDYLITSLPGIDISTLNFTQYAGHIEISSETDGNLFFWMIESENKQKEDKLILWLNGGPGCSSMDGLFLENGPYRVNKDKTLSVNAGGWQEYATVIYVDQPVGTGFSFSDFHGYRKNMNQITDDLVVFIDRLLELFPNLKSHDLYIAGESFAGTYIPYIAHQLLELNRKERMYNIKGIAIGNGWISPQHQYDAYYDYSVKYNLISSDYMSVASNHLKDCHDALKDTESIHVSTCERILTDVIDSSTHENDKGELVCMNSYDIRLKEEPSPECGLTWPYELESVTEYLRLTEVRKAIHSDKQLGGWSECTSAVSRALFGDESKPSYHLLPRILEDIPVLLYSGEYDLICNYLGTEYIIGNMTWNGATGFKKTTKKEQWKIDEHVVGHYKEERNLSYVFIKDGSHMVPYDKPLETLDMINRFMQVGNNRVNGKDSYVGSRPNHTTTVTPEETPMDTQQDTPPQEEEIISWTDYYSVAALVIAILAFMMICYYCSRKRKHSATAEFGGAPQQTREGIKKSRTIFDYFKRKNRKTFRLEHQDESNELDELVVDMPAIFEADAFSDEEPINTVGSHHPNKSQLSVAEDDSDFDDFADWDDGESLAGHSKNNTK